MGTRAACRDLAGVQNGGVGRSSEACGTQQQWAAKFCSERRSADAANLCIETECNVCRYDRGYSHMSSSAYRFLAFSTLPACPRTGPLSSPFSAESWHVPNALQRLPRPAPPVRLPCLQIQTPPLSASTALAASPPPPTSPPRRSTACCPAKSGLRRRRRGSTAASGAPYRQAASGAPYTNGDQTLFEPHCPCAVTRPIPRRQIRLAASHSESNFRLFRLVLYLHPIRRQSSCSRRKVWGEWGVPASELRRL